MKSVNSHKNSKQCALITDETVENIARLAKIELDKDEIKNIKSELAEILEYMDVLNSIDTDGIEPMSHVFDISNVMRDDVVKQGFEATEIVKNAPEHTEDSFVVPKAVE